MTLPEYAIKRPVTTVMVFTGIVFMGLVAILELPQELFPRINFPQITVVTDYVNAAPEEIETLITKPLEETISSVSGLRRIESTSREGKSTITVSFNWNQNIDFAALAVREKIDLVKERLPKESEDPVVLKFDPLSRPIMILSVTGKLPPSDLKSISEHTLRDNLEKVEGVASVTVSGGLDREIIVDLDQGPMQAAGVSILEVIDQVDAANISYPAGSIKKGLYEYLIRTVGEFRSVGEIGYTVVKTDANENFERVNTGFIERGSRGPRETLDTKREGLEKGISDKRMVLLHDIAEIRDSFREKTTISRYNQKENVSLAIQKQATTNAVDLVKQIKQTIAFLHDELEARGVHVEIVYDHSAFIKSAIASTRNNAIEGGILAAFVLLLFLRDPRSSGIVALSIPISVMGSFLFLKLQGITLNTMSLAGMALGTGMIVDNCIVVIENIFRLREEGHSPEESSIRGTNEVFWPVLSSTLTTDAVFLPLIIFVPGIAGQLFKDLSWAVIHSSNISFLVSVWLIPMAAVHVHPRKKNTKVHELQARTQGFFQKLSPKSQNAIFIQILSIGIISFLVGLFLFRTLDTEVIPKVDQGQFLVKVNLPVGSTIDATDAVVGVIENRLRSIPEVENIQVTIGSSTTAKAGEVRVETLRPSQGLLLVTLKTDRKRSSYTVLHELQKMVETEHLEKADIEYMMQESEYEFATTGGRPIGVEIKGYDLAYLQSLAEEIKKKIREIPGVVDISDDVGEPSPETKIEIDKKKASLYGISARDISLTAKAALDGAVATEFKEAGREVDVRVRLKKSDRVDVDKLRDLLVYSDHLHVTVPLKGVATIKPGYGPSEIRRKDQIRTLMVTASIQRGFKEKDVLMGVSEAVSRIERPNAYEVKLVGKAKEVKESFRSIAYVIVLALVLNYMIMAAQFESFVQPLIIMLTVPLAMFGVALALWLTGTSVSTISLLGIMILAGTVVNNAIVLIDFINQRRMAGEELVSASIESSFVRFRPIVMSALTTLAGLIPLALGIGEGAELQAPLAIAMGGGVMSGTLLTLFVIPAVYVLVVRLADSLTGVPELDESILEEEKGE
ncbi:MAG: efflux RND transporter permease subunit [Candidatus Omnitrophica bacterium]|nr:efflux RND transporter permease subunit [Candidatus Omnitrophota bacterium]